MLTRIRLPAKITYQMSVTGILLADFCLAINCEATFSAPAAGARMKKYILKKAGVDFTKS